MNNVRIIGRVKKLRQVNSAKKGMIVVADDDPAILDAMKMVLELYNFQVETIDGGDVVTKLKFLKPKLLFLDICLSGIDGREVCKTLKTLDATKDIPIIMISASCDLINAIRGSGANDYLAKPFEMQDLLSKVNKFLFN